MIIKKKHRKRQKKTLKTKNRNGKLYNLKIVNKNINIFSKTLIHGAHEAIPYAPEFIVFATLGAHDHCSCAFSDFKISDFGLFPCYQGGYPR